MSLSTFSKWLYDTPVSQAIQTISWVIPTAQSIHIVAIAVLAGSAIVLDLKLAGLIARTETPMAVFRRYMPWLWSSLAVLVGTGTVMVVGEPERVMMNWVFWTKMTLVVVAFLTTLVMGAPIRRQELGEPTGVWALLVKPLGLFALGVWVLIIVCGRWIGYAM